MKVQTNTETTQASAIGTQSNESIPAAPATTAVKIYSEDDTYILETRLLWLRDDNDHSGTDLPIGEILHVGENIPNRGQAESLDAAKAVALKSIHDSLTLVYKTSGQPVPEYALLEGVVSFDAHTGAAIHIAWGNEVCRAHPLAPVTTKYTTVIPAADLDEGDDKEPKTYAHRTYQRLSRTPDECRTTGTTSEIILGAEALIFSTNTYLPEYPGYEATQFAAGPLKNGNCSDIGLGRCFDLDFTGDFVTVPFVFEIGGVK